MRALPLSCAVMLLAAAGCSRRVEAPAEPRRSAIEVSAPGGELTLVLAASERGYALADRTGRRIGDVVIERDALRVLDPDGGVLSSVERRGDGFALRDHSGAVVLEAEATAAGHALSRPGGAAFGSRDPSGLVVGGHRIFALLSGAYAQVLRDGDSVLEVRGLVDNSAASFLALSELPFPERVALMLWMSERA